MSLAPNEIFESTTERYLAYLAHKAEVQKTGANSWSFETFCSEMQRKDRIRQKPTYVHHPATGFFGYFQHEISCPFCCGDCDE